MTLETALSGGAPRVSLIRQQQQLQQPQGGDMGMPGYGGSPYAGQRSSFGGRCGGGAAGGGGGGVPGSEHAPHCSLMLPCMQRTPCKLLTLLLPCCPPWRRREFNEAPYGGGGRGGGADQPRGFRNYQQVRLGCSCAATSLLCSSPWAGMACLPASPARLSQRFAARACPGLPLICALLFPRLPQRGGFSDSYQADRQQSG